MELYTTEKFFCENSKKNKNKYFLALVEIGEYLELISNLVNNYFETTNNNDIKKTEKFEISNNFEDQISLIANIKKIVVIITTLKNLPKNNKIRKKLISEFKLIFLDEINYNKNLNILLKSSINSKNNKNKYNNNNNDDDDDIFWEATKNNHKNKINNNNNNYYDNKYFFNNKNEPTTTTSNNIKNININHINIENHLFNLLVNLLQINKKNYSNDQKNFINHEINEVFKTWRCPQLLFDYFFMHNSNIELKNLYIRFLKALFGFSSETIDDIRYRDFDNVKHLSFFPAELIESWISGKTKNNIKNLPGFNDAQTLFMIGFFFFFFFLFKY
jgi:hypothetical protein